MTEDKCNDCPCPDTCIGQVLCSLAADPSRHAHIRNVSAIKRGAAMTANSSPVPKATARRSIQTPCCG